MELPKQLKRIQAMLDRPRSYEAVFGALKSGPLEERKGALEAAFRGLALQIHPDRFAALAASEREAAEAVFRRLVEFSKAAATALEEGHYEASIAGPAPSFWISSPLTRYELDQVAFARGSFSTLYRGHSVAGLPVIVKVAARPQDNPWLERELTTLDRFHKRPKLREVARFIPEPLDHFMLEGGAGGLRTTVFDPSPGMLSLAELKEHFPSGLEPAAGAWVGRRLLAQACAAAMLGRVHGALLPEHLLVHPLTHDPVHIGWAHALKPGARIKQLVPGRRDLYPEEVMDRKPVDGRTDIAMAGRTMVWLLGGDPESSWLPSSVPEPFAAVFRRCAAPRRRDRYQSAVQALAELTRAAHKCWGKQYRRLELQASLESFSAL